MLNCALLAPCADAERLKAAICGSFGGYSLEAAEVGTFTCFGWTLLLTLSSQVLHQPCGNKVRQGRAAGPPKRIYTGIAKPETPQQIKCRREDRSEQVVTNTKYERDETLDSSRASTPTSGARPPRPCPANLSVPVPATRSRNYGSSCVSVGAALYLASAFSNSSRG